MIYNWANYTLGDVADIQTGPFGSQLHARDYIEKGIPSIMPQNIGDNTIIEDGIAHIAPHDAARLNRYLVQLGDIVYSRRGDVEKRAIIKERHVGWLCGTGCLRVRPHLNAVDSSFIAHQLGNPVVRAWIVQHAIGATMPNLNTSILSQVPVTIPPLPEQRAIAATLSCLDDKIELNNRMNKTLEEIAQAIFKSWFVDFEPFQGGEFVDSELGRIPKGWRVGVLADLLDVKYGKDHKKLPDGDIPVYGSGGLMRYADKAIFTGESVLIPRKGTLSNLMYVNEAFWTVDTMFYTVMKCETVAKYVYQSLLTKDLASMNAGSAVPSMTTDILNHLPVIIPSSSTLDQFDSILAPLYACITSNRQHIAKLVQIRSSLLPKLMSGEIHVPLEVQDGIS